MPNPTRNKRIIFNNKKISLDYYSDEDYDLIIEDSFTRANTTPPASIGVPPVYNTPSTGGAWTDPSTAWKILNDILVPGAGAGGATLGPRRPNVESVLNQRIKLHTGQIPAISTTNLPYIITGRMQTASAFVTSILINLRINVNALTGAIVFGCAASGGAYKTITGASFPIKVGAKYVLVLSLNSLYAGGFTVASWIVYDENYPSIIISYGSDTVQCTYASFATNPGLPQLVQDRNDITSSASLSISKVKTYKRKSNGLICLSRTLLYNTNSYIISIADENAPWTAGSSTPVFTCTGLDVVIVSQTIISSKVARIVVNTGGLSGKLLITDPVTGRNCFVNVATTIPIYDTLVAGNIIPVEDTSTTVKLSLGLVTGGKAPYTYQWYRSLAWAFTPTGTELLSGATSIDLVDTPPDDQIYCYRCIITDSSGTAQTHTTASAPGMRNWKAPLTSVYTPINSIPAIKLGIIGDSISTDSCNVINTLVSEVAAKGITITPYKQAVSGSFTGTTSSGWNPTGVGTYYATAKTAFLAAGITHIVLQLGTNDAQAFNVSKASYITNMNAILAQLLIDFPSVKVMISIASLSTRSPGAEQNALFITYKDAIDQIIAANTNAWAGDFNVPVWSYGRFNLYADDIHPNSAGGTEWGKYQADAFFRRLDGV